MLLEEQIRLSLMENVLLVLTLLKVVVCSRCSLQMMHFFRTLKASLCFLVLFWLMWLLSRGLVSISIFLRLLQFRSPTIGGDGAAFLILELE